LKEERGKVKGEMQYIENLNLKLELEGFSGEPRILLQQVKEERLDICNFSLMEIVNQYLDWLLDFQGSIDIAADFLLIFSSLIFLKSVSLLPKREVAPDEEKENLENLLEQKLWAYEQIKNIAKELRSKEEERSLFFGRPRMKIEEDTKEDSTKQERVNIQDLITAFAQISSFIPDKEIKLVKEKWTIRDKISQILNRLKNESFISLRKLFQSAETKTEMIVIFLATLELIKTEQITVRQEGLFGEIWIYPAPSYPREFPESRKGEAHSIYGETDK